MLPVTKNNIIKLDLNKEFLTRSEEKYKKLYDKYIDGTLNTNIAKRCCNFKLLEEKCNEFNNIAV